MIPKIFNSSTLFRQLIPNQPCILCGSLSTDGVWCQACDSNLPHLTGFYCPNCGLPSHGGEICGQCLVNAPSFNSTLAAYAYAFPIDKLIQAVKFSGRLALINQLTDALTTRIVSRPDYILAMPLHPFRLRERGFNQSQLFAQRLSKILNITLLTNICTRTQNTPPQSTLPWQQRRKNMRGVFSCSADLSGKHISIVDDVMTTGISIEELAQTLRKAGATQISAWVIARTLPH